MRCRARVAIAALGCAVWFSEAAAAQQTVVHRIRIVDDLTGEPIAGAVATLEPGGLRQTTDAAGVVEFDVAEGAYEFAAAAFGYAPVVVNLSIPPRATRVLELRMQPVPVELQGIDAEGERRDVRVGLSGTVRDAISGEALVGATVSLPFGSRRWITMTDPEGGFRIGGIPLGMHWVQARHVGYEASAVAIDHLSQEGEIELLLRPDSVMMRGVAQLEREWESGRRAIATMPVRAISREQIARGRWHDVSQMLSTRGVFLTPCEDPFATACSLVRGSPVEIEVCIDGVPSIGGVDQLRTYQPRELHLVEVFGRGRYVRAYTVGFMETYGRRVEDMMSSCPDPNLGM